MRGCLRLWSDLGLLAGGGGGNLIFVYASIKKPKYTHKKYTWNFNFTGS